MYHEMTYHAVSARRRKAIILTALVALVIALLLGVNALMQSALREQTALSIRDSIVDTSVQCYAIEGSYPTQLVYLEQKYGLVLNHREYVVDYEWLGDNVPPSVVVRPR